MYVVCIFTLFLSIYVKFVHLAVLEHTGCCFSLVTLMAALGSAPLGALWILYSLQTCLVRGLLLSSKLSMKTWNNSSLVFSPGSKRHHQKYLRFVVVLH